MSTPQQGAVARLPLGPADITAAGAGPLGDRGEDEVVDGPFGPAGVTSADYAPSGRSLEFIENFIRDAVLPRYVGGTEDDLAIFCGSGAAAAVKRTFPVTQSRTT